MSAQDSSTNYLEQMGSLFNTVSSYMRLPVLISSVHLPLQPSFLPVQRGGMLLTVTAGRRGSLELCTICQAEVSFPRLPRPRLCRTDKRCDRALIYPSHIPAGSRTEVIKPSQFDLSDFEDLMIPTPDNEKLSAFYIRGPKGRSKSNITVLMFHGNAGNIGHRVPIARMLVRSMGCNVFMLEYRGYGLSTGSPDETGLMIDAQTAYDYLRKRAETRDHDIVIYGQSLGGAVAVKLAAKNQNDPKLTGLVLENTFLSMRKLIPSYEPFTLKNCALQLTSKGSFLQPGISHCSAIKSGHPRPSSQQSPSCPSCSFLD
jgi:hypothetical protein